MHAWCSVLAGPGRWLLWHILPCPHSTPTSATPTFTCLPRALLQHAERLDREIVYDRDFDYDYFGFKVRGGESWNRRIVKNIAE